MEAALTQGASVADDPEVSVLLSALDVPAPFTEGAVLVRAHMVLGHADQLIGFDSVLLADFAAGAQDVGLLAVTVPDPDAANALVSRITANWQAKPLLRSEDSLEAMWGLMPDIDVIAGMPSVVRIHITQPRDERLGLMVNGSYQQLLTLVTNGALPELTTD